MCGYIVFYNENKHLEHSVDRRWNLTAEQLRQLLLVSEVRLNVPVKPCEQPEEIEHEASTSPDPCRNEAPAEGREHDQAP